MPWARASELHRLLACPAAAHLPRLVEISERRDDAAAWGTALHHWKETGSFPPDLPPRRQAALDRRLEVLAEYGKTRDNMWRGGS